MVQLKCPVCHQEYTQGTVEFCGKCCYLLSTYSEDLLHHPEVQEREKKRLHSAKEAWKKWSHAYSDLKQKLEAETAKKGNQNTQNNALLEQHLENISSNIQHLPEILTLLQNINENLSYQSQNLYQNLYNLSQSHQQSQQLANPETPSSQETNSEDSISTADNLSANTAYYEDNTEMYNLVENYNQQADFADKIEVSETSESKSRRWGGSQEPAVFEAKGRGEYWIINNQYLVPKPKQKINEHNYKTISILFECYNYEQNATDNMTLIKPAKVSAIYGEEKWQLQEMGILKF